MAAAWCCEGGVPGEGEPVTALEVEVVGRVGRGQFGGGRCAGTGPETTATAATAAERSRDLDPTGGCTDAEE